LSPGASGTDLGPEACQPAVFSNRKMVRGCCLKNTDWVTDSG